VSGGYLAFLGTYRPGEGAETAITLAHAAGLPLKIVAKVRPLIDGKHIDFVGEIDERQKGRLSWQCRRPAVPDLLAGAVRACHHRGDGLRNAEPSSREKRESSRPLSAHMPQSSPENP
jgi:hypothetical protein